MADLVPYARPVAPDRVVAAAELAELRRRPRVIDGEVVASPAGPIWHVVLTVSVQLALLVAAAAWYVTR